MASVAALPPENADTCDYAVFGAGLIGPDKAKAGEVVQSVGEKNEQLRCLRFTNVTHLSRT